LTNINLQELLKTVSDESEELNEEISKFLKIMLLMRPNQNEIADTIIGLLGYVNSFENEENFNKVFATLVSGLALVR
jgi:hypothetical protein